MKLMKQSIFILIFLFFSNIYVKSQSLEQILESHYKAVGIEFLKEVQTIQYKGKYINHFLKKDGMPVKDYYLNVDFILSIDKQKSYLEQVFGKYGEDAYAFSNVKFWTDPSGALPSERIPNKSDKLHIQSRIDTESVLYNWKNKGYKLVKLNNAIFENKSYYKSRLTTSEKDTLYYYINPENAFIYKMSYNGDLTDGKEHKSVTFMNYKKVHNILFPFTQFEGRKC